MEATRLAALLETENEHLQKLNKIVEDAVEEEKLLSTKLPQFENTDLSFTSRMADKVAGFGGSWKFIFSFLFFMLIWISVNLFFLQVRFDTYPFILLNLLLSTVAALQAPIIMMSQNRKEEKDRERAVNDYMINLKAEIEVRNLHGKIDLLMTEQMKTLFELQKEQLELMNDLSDVLQSIRSANVVSAIVIDKNTIQ